MTDNHSLGELGDLEARLAHALDRISSGVSSRLTGLNAESARLNSARVEAEALVEDITARAAPLEQRLEQQQAELTAAEKRIEEMIANAAAQEERLSEQRTLLEAAEAALVDQQTKLAETEARLEQSEHQFTQLSELHAASEVEMQKLQAALDEQVQNGQAAVEQMPSEPSVVDAQSDSEAGASEAGVTEAGQSDAGEVTASDPEAPDGEALGSASADTGRLERKLKRLRREKNEALDRVLVLEEELAAALEKLDEQSRHGAAEPDARVLELRRDLRVLAAELDALTAQIATLSADAPALVDVEAGILSEVRALRKQRQVEANEMQRILDDMQHNLTLEREAVHG